MDDTFSDDEVEVIRGAIFGLVASLSEAGDSGLAGALRESEAATQALAAFPAAIRPLVAERPSKLTWGRVPANLADTLARARAVISSTLTGEAAAFDAALLYLAIRCAAAAEGTSADERAVLDTLREAIELPPLDERHAKASRS